MPANTNLLSNIWKRMLDPLGSNMRYITDAELLYTGLWNKWNLLCYELRFRSHFTSSSNWRTCCYHGDEFRAKIAIARKPARVWMKVLKVSCCDALLCAQVVWILTEAEKTAANNRSSAVNRVVVKWPPHLVSAVTDSTYPGVLRQKVSKDPPHLNSKQKQPDCWWFIRTNSHCQCCRILIWKKFKRQQPCRGPV